MKIFIIKTGLTETFDLSSVHTGVVSLGDVVRTTVILNLFLKNEVTWFTSVEAQALLVSIPSIKEVLVDNNNIDLSMFDLVVNLERDDKILDWIKKTKVKRIIGFTTSQTLMTDSLEYSLKEWMLSLSIKKLNWSEKLYSLFSRKWVGENYCIPESILDNSRVNIHDIGLNWQVGVKWPTKAWPKEKWIELEKRFSSCFKVSWQEGFSNLVHYMNWINSCSVLVTHDSLGLHLGKALNKKVIVLYGPTSSEDTPLGVNNRALSAKDVEGFDCLPCYKDHCHNKIHCMDYISVDKIEIELKNLLRQNYE